MAEVPNYEVRDTDDGKGLLLLDGGIEVMVFPDTEEGRLAFNFFLLGLETRGGYVFNLNYAKEMEPDISL